MRFSILFTASLLAIGSARGQTIADTSLLMPINKDLPGWIQFSGEYRARAEGYTGGGFVPDRNEGYLLSRFRLNLNLKVRSWLRVYAQMQDSRVLGNDAIPDAAPYQDHFDLRLAYVEGGDIEKSHFAMRVGRQELAFDKERVLGTANWLNTPRSFDAVRATARAGIVRVDLFASSVVNPVDGTFDHHKGGEDLHGAWGTISHLIPGSTIEPYFLWRLGAGLKTEAGAPAKRSIKHPALRIAGTPGRGWDYEAQVIRQYGTIGTDVVRAYAWNLDLGHAWKQALWTPRAYGDFAYASGDNNAHDGVRNTYDQMYPSNHGLYGVADQFGWRNLRDAKAGVELNPIRRLQIASAAHSLYLANSHDGLYNVMGNLIVRKADGSARDHIGQELDGTATFVLNPGFLGGLGFGHIYPGEFLKRAIKGASLNYPFFFVTYAF